MKQTLPVSADEFIDLLLDAVCLVDRDSRFLFVSEAGERIFGYRPDEMVGRFVLEFVHPDDRDKTVGAIGELLSGEEKPLFENRYLRKDGAVAHIMWSARWSEKDQVRVAVARDITQQKHAESLQKDLYARLEYMAHHDPLTNVPNRALLLDRFGIALARAQRATTRLAVLYLDLNNFKQINDSYGHAVGDELLIRVAKRLQRCVRESDTVSRVGGDEFVVVVDGTVTGDDVDAVRQKIVLSLARPFKLDGGITLTCSPSIGVAVYPDDGVDYETLIHHADSSMYVSKRERTGLTR
ncbi:hypothetical protein BKP64_09805 [Marinobacter salinus]|uniref:Diguanylate cyclase n=1 Tax=Marinobacter salinus TaxID=1874317 RepID=A0A1D9GLQ8_9GAMM|nr:diguanylate cyclase [Marinobacter salinus]AOY88435.1 hypothetical protein BKP64_09805 [Marinobacter salinus]